MYTVKELIQSLKDVDNELYPVRICVRDKVYSPTQEIEIDMKCLAIDQNEQVVTLFCERDFIESDHNENNE